MTATVVDPDVSGLGLTGGDLSITLTFELLFKVIDVDVVSLNEALALQRGTHEVDAVGGDPAGSGEVRHVALEADGVSPDVLSSEVHGCLPGAGSARRSTLPFGASGRASRNTQAEGIM